MQIRYSKFIRSIHLVGDILLLNISFIISYFIKFDSIAIDKTYPYQYFSLLLILNLSWFLVIGLLKIYDIIRTAQTEQIIIDLVKAVFLHVLIISASLFFLKFHLISRELIIVTYLIFVFLILLWRMLFLYALKLYRKSGFNYRRVVVVGANTVGHEIMQFLTSDVSLGYNFLGFFDDNYPQSKENGMVIGKVENVNDFALKNKVDEIYYALSDTSVAAVKELIEFSEKNMIRFKIVPEHLRYVPKNVVVDYYSTIPVILIRKEPLENIFNRFVKRTFDLFFSLFVIVVLFSWLFPIIAVFVKLSSPGPVFFRQKRSGKQRKEFWCLKFRTMKINKGADSQQATEDDIRITAAGKFLRKTSLDELPQFLNVLKGDMSVVGPRPHMLKHTEEYSKIINKFMVRHFITPGITGWAQVNGYRGITTDAAKMQKRVEYDVWYIENWSFLLDIKIILNSIWILIIGDKHAF